MSRSGYPAPGTLCASRQAGARKAKGRPEAGRPASITRLRPGFVYGPDFSNPALRLMGARLAVVPDDGGRTQLVHQDELARAFCEAAFRDLPGAYLLVTDDSAPPDALDRLREAGGQVVLV